MNKEEFLKLVVGQKLYHQCGIQTEKPITEVILLQIGDSDPRRAVITLKEGEHRYTLSIDDVCISYKKSSQDYRSSSQHLIDCHKKTIKSLERQISDLEGKLELL